MTRESINKTLTHCPEGWVPDGWAPVCWVPEGWLPEGLWGDGALPPAAGAESDGESGGGAGATASAALSKVEYLLLSGHRPTAFRRYISFSLWFFVRCANRTIFDAVFCDELTFEVPSPTGLTFSLVLQGEFQSFFSFHEYRHVSAPS